jgi:hypothetical protein
MLEFWIENYGRDPSAICWACLVRHGAQRRLQLQWRPNGCTARLGFFFWKSLVKFNDLKLTSENWKHLRQTNADETFPTVAAKDMRKSIEREKNFKIFFWRPIAKYDQRLSRSFSQDD